MSADRLTLARIAYRIALGREPIEIGVDRLGEELAQFVTDEELETFARVGLEAFQQLQTEFGIGAEHRVEHRDYLWDGAESLLICAAAEDRPVWLMHVVRYSDVERQVRHMTACYREKRGLPLR